MDDRKVIYYRDELNDEFSEARIEARRIDGSYEYCRDSLFRRFTAFFWYRVVATPVAFCYLKLVWRHKTEGRKKLKGVKTGFFLYGNHTHAICNTCIPTAVAFPERVYIICSAANVSIPHIGLAAASMGALPLPEGTQAYKNFRAAIERRIGEGRAVAIYRRLVRLSGLAWRPGVLFYRHVSKTPLFQASAYSDLRRRAVLPAGGCFAARGARRSARRGI